MSIVNDKPTPETNSAIKEQAGWMRPFVSITFDGITYDSPVATLCRKLEQERDEARSALEYIAYSNRSALHIEDYAKEFLARIK